jgi:hypothetical protein
MPLENASGFFLSGPGLMKGTQLSVQAVQSLPGGLFVVPRPANEFFSR